MKVISRRRSALTAVAGLFMASVVVGVTSPVVEAAPGTLTTTNACINNATTTYSNLLWTMSGTGNPNPQTLGNGNVVLSNSKVAVDVPASLLIAGYGLGALTVGTNTIPTTVYVARQATNVDVGGGVSGTKVQVDNFTVGLITTITDPDGVPGTGDESATPLAVNQVLPDMTVTPLGGDVKFSQAPAGSLPTFPAGVVAAGAITPAGSVYVSASVAGGVLRVNFDCSPGTTNVNPGIDPLTGLPFTSGPTFTAAGTIGAFESVTVVAPPTAPVCKPEPVSVGVSQSVIIDLTDNCTDVNESQGGGSPFTFDLGTPSTGTLTPTATNGVYSYAAPPTDPGDAVLIGFTATDSDTPPLTSTSVDISITVLADQCDATEGLCDLTQIVVQQITGTTMTLDKVPGLVAMSPVTLDGTAQVSTGALQTITVTNARGTAAAWSVTAYATDIGAAGAPTFTVPVAPGATVPLCSVAGAGPFAANPALAASISSDRLCIPGDNLGWSPAAIVAHSDIPGDVAQVIAGPANAADGNAWLAALVTAGNGNDPNQGVDGLGGLGGSSTLCSAPVNHSGGTFTCNAALYLGVPASAGAGTYTGGIILTLV